MREAHRLLHRRRQRPRRFENALAAHYNIEDSIWPGRDLYAFDVNTETLTDLTTADPSGADVYGVVATSDDLDTVYFVAGGDLDPGSAADPGKPNLYVLHSGEIHFVATLDSSKSPGNDTVVDNHLWSTSALYRVGTVRVSPDGRHLLFASRAPLTAYDNAGPDCYTGSCSEVYLYDLAADSLTCISCPLNGAPAQGDARLTSLEASASTGDLPRNLLADGSRAYFETDQSLLAADSNGRRDVYQWADDGSSAGRLSLISAGRGEQDSTFVDASADGFDVFFTTYDRLTGSDIDRSTDLDTARLGGGFPEPVPPPACEGDACLSPPVVPNDPTPASSSLSDGPGNTAAIRARCPKGKIKRNGHCVVKKRAKHTKHSSRRRASNDRRAHR